MNVKKGKKNIESVADYLIAATVIKQNSVSPLKLQKLLYYFQAWHMVYFDGDSVFENAPQAWVNGPVYPTIYRKYSEKLNMYDNFTLLPEYCPNACDKIIDSAKKNDLFNKDEQEFCSQFIEAFAPKDATYLSLLTHGEAPWKNARNGLDPFVRSDREISLQDMLDYYEKIKEQG